MMTKYIPRCFLRAILVAVGIILGSSATSAPTTWIGGNGDWDASVANWNTGDEPDADDEAIFNTNHTVNLANASETIMALTMSGSIELLLNGNDLTVNGGDVTLSGAGTLLDVPTNSVLNTDDVFVNADASLTLHGGTITMAQSGGEAVLTVAPDGAIGGFGTINSTDVIAAANTTVLSVGGSLTVLTFDLFSAQAGTLSINVPANGRVDLDQTNAVISITRNDTLDINGAAHDIDAYSGTLNMAEGATIDMSSVWTMDTGAINVNTNGINVNTAGAAATIAGSELTQTGGTLNLADNFDSLRFSAPYTATGGTIINNGLMIFDAEGIVGPAADFQMNGAAASITVTDGNILSVTNGDFDLGGSGNDTSNVTTIGDGSLFVNMDFDSGAGDVMDHRIELNGGQLDVSNTDAGFAGTDTMWHLSGGVVNANLGFCLVSGDDLIIGAQTINVAAGATFRAGFLGGSMAVEIQNATINVGGNVDLNSTTRWTNTNVSVTGAGTLNPGASTIDAAVTWGVATVDLDDGPITLNDDLTINADSIDDSGDGFDNTLVLNDDADLIINLTGGQDEWTIDAPGVINIDAFDALTGSGIQGSDVNVLGTVNVSGNSEWNARVDLGGTINTSLGTDLIRLVGGSLADPNRLEGGTITGPGFLDLSGEHALVGFGTIGTGISAGFGAQVLADDGILTITGDFIVDSLGTNDADGIVNVTNPWSVTDGAGVPSANSVYLNWGELRGAAITNDGTNGISGHGLVSARVVNNSRINAEGGTLIVETAANDNDWDGAGAGQLNAVSGDLEIRDDIHFPFTGTVVVGAGRTVLADGFEVQFQPGSTLTLTQGTYRSIAGDPLGLHGDFGGTMTVNAGGSSRLWMLAGAEFLASSATTLQDDLRLQTGITYVRVGASFTGPGALVNLALSGGLAFEDGVDSADLGVLIRNNGSLSLGKDADFLDTAAQISGSDFEQTSSGSIAIELGGLGLDQFDRLDLTGTASLAGTLRLRVFGGYMPALGDTFNVLSAAGGLGGTTFASVLQPVGMPAGRFFSAIYSATTVQLLVISNLPGDYNNDGVVDAGDYVVWRKHEGTTNTLLNDPIGGTIGEAQYDQWSAHFGDTAGSGTGAGGAVPEPGAFVLAAQLFGLWMLGSSSSRRASQ
jgi:hypothetical protein